MARKDSSQRLYRNYIKGTEAEFRADAPSPFVAHMVLKDKLHLNGLMADGAMFFTTDPVIYERVMMSEKGRYWREVMTAETEEDCQAVGRVYDYSTAVQRGFHLFDELPTPFDNVMIISEGDKVGDDGKVSRGRKTMVFSHDTARLKDFTTIVMRAMTSHKDSMERGLSIEASFENTPVKIDSEKARERGYLDETIDAWMKANPDLVK